MKHIYNEQEICRNKHTEAAAHITDIPMERMMGVLLSKCERLAPELAI